MYELFVLLILVLLIVSVGRTVMAILFEKLRKSLRKVLFLSAVVSIALASISWYNHDIDAWFASLGVSTLFLMGVSLSELIGSTFLRDSYDEMPTTTACCIPGFGCSSSDSVLFLTCFFRGLSGATAATSFYVSWTCRSTFWQGHTELVQVMWATTSGLWILSCVPHFICLLQCAAEKESFKILLFRKRVTIWLIHDMVLGVFWLYLSYMLDHLLKDDDSEWRTVFLSMLSWHIIIYVCRQLYLSDIWRTTKHVACCAPQTVGRWSIVLMLVGMSAVYGVLVHVVRDTVEMGCSIWHIIVLNAALFVGSVGYLMSPVRAPIKQKREEVPTVKTMSSDYLDF